MKGNTKPPYKVGPLAIRFREHEDELVITDGVVIVSTVWPVGDDFNEADLPGPKQKANAEFIVRACNCHDELVGAIILLLDAMRDLADEAGDVPQWNSGGSCHEACNHARTILAKAKPEA